MAQKQPQHSLQVNDSLFEKLNKLAIKETTKRKKVVSWSKLAKEILYYHIEQIEQTQKTERAQPPVPKKR